MRGSQLFAHSVRFGAIALAQQRIKGKSKISQNSQSELLYDTVFQKYLDLDRKLTAFYYEERYPPGPITSYSKEEIEEMLGAAEEIIKKLKGVIE